MAVKWVEKIEKRRNELGWSQEEIAGYMNLSPATYQNWIYKNHKPNYDNLMKIQEFLEETEEKIKN